MFKNNCGIKYLLVIEYNNSIYNKYSTNCVNYITHHNTLFDPKVYPFIMVSGSDSSISLNNLPC